MAKTVGKLKIALVLDDSLDKTGGVQEYIISLGDWLRAEGHQVHFLVGKTTRTDIANVHSLSRNVGVRFNGNHMSMPLPASRRKLRALLAREQYDVLHVQVPYSPFLAHRLILAAPAHTAVIGTFHIVAYSQLVTLATRALAIWTRRSTRRFDQMISVSSAAVVFARETYHMPSVVIPNAIEYKRFNTAQPIRPDDPLINVLFLGRLVARKGCQYLLQAVAALQTRADLPAYTITICGKGPLDASLRAYATQHGISERVRFVGYVSEPDKPGYYAGADIAVFPSTGGESFGIVLVEAMATGRTVVLAGDNSGYRTVMEPQPELLFQPQDTAELAEKLAGLLQDAGRRKALADWGGMYAKNFDASIVGAKIVAEYQQALRKRAKV
ncbi:MAG: hypothetical protein JWN38_271 [Candidatus Saccharibacteria bacterium]|nr:hypothetical protein [Candidatus Saccharibacteria bacterium]